MLNAGSLPLAVGNRCAEETAGMDKLLAHKYAIKAKGEDADRRDSLTSAYFVEILDVWPKSGCV
jgi:hypothetical protein